MKKTKVIIPALGILLLSTAASVTGTVAWFSANTTVSATDMQVKALAQQGIVISNGYIPEGGTAADMVYSYTAATVNTDLAELKPASTGDLVHWYYSTSNDPATANTGALYTGVTASDKADYYAEHNFYIRSSTGDAITTDKLVMKNVSVKKADGTPAAQDLSASLRVGVLVAGDSKAYIFAPISGGTLTYTVHGVDDGETSAHTLGVTAKDASGTHTTTAAVNLPDNKTQGLNVKVFIWFEGEDPKCISNNLVANNNLETLVTTIEFSHAA